MCAGLEFGILNLEFSGGMNIFGIGVDVVEVERIAAAIERQGEAFVKRVFTDGERAYCEGQKHPEQHYAARFAVKEAVAKAFGTGIGRDLSLLDMDIIRLESGRPELVLSGGGKEFAGRQGITGVKISLSHTGSCAVGNAVAIIP